ESRVIYSGVIYSGVIYSGIVYGGIVHDLDLFFGYTNRGGQSCLDGPVSLW
ncbi:MAG: hypothetical protein ACI9HK_003521, partial [Pirellulaceae bacterium]